MAASRLNPEEVQFIQSLRRMLARGGHLSDELLSPTAPIAAPKGGGKAPSVVVEPRKGYWTGNPEFSRTRVGLYPEVSGSETILEILNTPGPPRGRGVILQRQDVELTAVPLLNYAVRANIQFGIGGQVNSVKVDWANTIVNVPGSMVRVNAEWLTTSTAFPYNVGSPSQIQGTLGVQITADPIVHKGYNTLTDYPSNPGGPPTYIDVPPYAVGFWYLPVPPVGATTGYWFALSTETSGVNTNQGIYLDSAIVANGYTAMNVLPPGTKRLHWDFSTLNINSSPIVWAIAL